MALKTGLEIPFFDEDGKLQDVVLERNLSKWKTDIFGDASEIVVAVLATITIALLTSVMHLALAGHGKKLTMRSVAIDYLVRNITSVCIWSEIGTGRRRGVPAQKERPKLHKTWIVFALIIAITGPMCDVVFIVLAQQGRTILEPGDGYDFRWTISPYRWKAFLSPMGCVTAPIRLDSGTFETRRVLQLCELTDKISTKNLSASLGGEWGLYIDEDKSTLVISSSQQDGLDLKSLNVRLGILANESDNSLLASVSRAQLVDVMKNVAKEFPEECSARVETRKEMAVLISKCSIRGFRRVNIDYLIARQIIGGTKLVVKPGTQLNVFQGLSEDQDSQENITKKYGVVKESLGVITERRAPDWFFLLAASIALLARIFLKALGRKYDDLSDITIAEAVGQNCAITPAAWENTTIDIKKSVDKEGVGHIGINNVGDEVDTFVDGQVVRKCLHANRSSAISSRC